MSIIKNVIKISTIGAGVIYGSKVFKNIYIAGKIYRRTKDLQKNGSDEFKDIVNFYKLMSDEGQVESMDINHLINSDREIDYIDAKNMVNELINLSTTTYRNRIYAIEKSESDNNLCHYIVEIYEYTDLPEKFSSIIKEKVCAPILIMDEKEKEKLRIPLFMDANFKNSCLKNNYGKSLLIVFLEEIAKIGFHMQYLLKEVPVDIKNCNDLLHKEMYFISNIDICKYNYISNILSKIDIIESMGMYIYNKIIHKIFKKYFMSDETEKYIYEFFHDMLIRGLLMYTMKRFNVNTKILKKFDTCFNNINQTIIPFDKYSIFKHYEYMLKVKKLYYSIEDQNYTFMENLSYSVSSINEEMISHLYDDKVKAPLTLLC